MNNSRLDQIEQMLKTDPNDSFLLYAKALELLKLENIAEAQNILEKLIDQNPDYVATYYQLGKLFEAQEFFDRAISIYKKGIVIAEEQRDLKTKSELEEALWFIDED